MAPSVRATQVVSSTQTRSSAMRGRLWVVAFGVLLAVGAALRVWYALSDNGIYWPDEIYQSLEPAHRLVYGYGDLAWEFVQGARHWAFPGLVAALLWMAGLVGFEEPGEYVVLVRLFFVTVSMGTAVGVYALARAFGASTIAAAVGATAFVLSAPIIYFAPRALSENASALLVAIGLALVLRTDSTTRRLIVGASLLGIATMFRLQSAPFAGAAVLILFLRGERRSAIRAAAVLAVWAVLFGAIDLLTWGSWFHSARVYLRLNLIEGVASNYGTSPFGYYAQFLVKSMPALAVVLILFMFAGARRAPGLFAIAAFIFILHSAVPHKEFRFLLPIFPIMFSLCALGIDQLGKTRKLFQASVAATLGAAILSATTFTSLNLEDIGAQLDTGARQSAHDRSGPENRLLISAHSLPDLCGIKIESQHTYWSGGYSYLHRDVPLYYRNGPQRWSGAFNYVIARTRDPGGGRIVATDNQLSLIKLANDVCQPA